MSCKGRQKIWARLAVLVLVAGLGGLGGRAAGAQGAPARSGADAAERSTPINAVPEKGEQEKDESEEFTHSAAVQKIGRMLGMKADQAAMAFTVLNFVVLAAGVGFITVKTLPNAFRDRSSAIQKNLVEARTATEEANGRLRAVEARLGRLDEEIAAMRQQAEAEASREDERLRVAMEEESAKILAAAEMEIEAATAAARRDLQRHAAELAIEQAARRLVITAETDRELVKGFAQTLAAEKGGRN